MCRDAAMQALGSLLLEAMPGDLISLLRFASTLSVKYKRFTAQVMYNMGLRLEQAFLTDAEFQVSYLSSDSAEHVDRDLAAYVQSGILCSRFVNSMSITVDRSRIAGKGLMNGAMVLPNNRACWMVPQECWASLGLICGEEGGCCCLAVCFVPSGFGFAPFRPLCGRLSAGSAGRPPISFMVGISLFLPGSCVCGQGPEIPALKSAPGVAFRILSKGLCAL